MVNRIIVVHVGDILKCPPALNVVRLAHRRKLETAIVTTSDYERDSYRASLPPECVVELIDGPYGSNRNLIAKAIRLELIKKQLIAAIDRLYSRDDAIVWIVSDVTLKHLGSSVAKYRYVLHFMELTEALYYSKRVKAIKLNAKELSDDALAVVVPNKSRACITQAWWGLEREPLVLPNKPVDDLSIEKGAGIDDPAASEIVDSLKGKKIILYQGIAHKERPLKPFYDAVKLLGDAYAFVTLGAVDPLSSIKDKQYSHIPFVQPPEHLRITSHAYIGVLSYFPVRAQYSILNAVFCAPNKSFEYARFGIPMIANSNCELDSIFRHYGCGECVIEFAGSEIATLIKAIDDDYARYSSGSLSYYSSVDMDKCFDEVLQMVSFTLMRGDKS